MSSSLPARLPGVVLCAGILTGVGALLASGGCSSSSTTINNTNCGPGTVLQDGQCVVADAATDGAGGDSTTASDSTTDDVDGSDIADSSGAETPPDASADVCSYISLSCTAECGGSRSNCYPYKCNSCSSKPTVVSALPFYARLPDHPTDLDCVQSPACGSSGTYFGIVFAVDVSPFPTNGYIARVSPGWSLYPDNTPTGCCIAPGAALPCTHIIAPSIWTFHVLATSSSATAGSLDIHPAKDGESCT